MKRLRMMVIVIAAAAWGCTIAPTRPLTPMQQVLWNCMSAGGSDYACEREALKWHYMNEAKPVIAKVIAEEYATDIWSDRTWDDAISGELYINCLRGGWDNGPRCGARTVAEWVRRIGLKTIRAVPQH